MGKYESTAKRSPGLARVLALPVLGTATLAAVILGGLARSGRELPPETTVPPTTQVQETAPTLPPSALGPEDFYMLDGFLTSDTVPVKRGVDVSEHQQEIDWQAVADSGVEFAFIRLGYRGYGNGELVIDHRAEENLTGAKNAGLSVGAYFFSQAMSPLEAAKEAAFCIRMLEGRAVDLPVVFDWEYISDAARTGDADMGTVTECALVFCRALEDAGYQPMVYFNPHAADLHLDLFRLQEYPFWLAYYTEHFDYPNRVDFWQYTDSGTVPGIPGAADVNLWLPNDGEREFFHEKD